MLSTTPSKIAKRIYNFEEDYEKQKQTVPNFYREAHDLDYGKCRSTKREGDKNG